MFMASSESGSARRAYSYKEKCVFLDVWDRHARRADRLDLFVSKYLISLPNSVFEIWKQIRVLT
jgi:hypothetical protein